VCSCCRSIFIIKYHFLMILICIISRIYFICNAIVILILPTPKFSYSSLTFRVSLSLLSSQDNGTIFHLNVIKMTPNDLIQPVMRKLIFKISEIDFFPTTFALLKNAMLLHWVQIIYMYILF